MNVTSRQLKAFLLTARHQSFSRAAEQLFITQSGMSMLIRELEEQLGFRLFERTTRRVTLSASGSQFLPAAERSLLELEAAAASIGRSASAARCRLAIGATPLLAGRLLPAAIAEYAQRDPGMQVVLHDGDRPQLIAAVDSGELDMALGCFLQPVPGMRRIALHRFTLMLVQPLAEAAQFARAPRWSDLAGRCLVGGPPDSPLQQLIDQHLQHLRQRGAPATHFNFYETQIAMVETGAGSAVLPSFCLQACRGRKVAAHQLTDPVVPIDLVQLVRRGRELPGAAEFTAFLTSYIARGAEPWAPAAVEAA